jgi:hypothetical protein
VPLRSCSPGQIHAVCYERLRAEPAGEIPRLGAVIGRSFDDAVFTRMRRHSLTTGPYSALKSGGDPVTNWTRRWGKDDVRSVIRILSMFGLDAVYNDKPMPRPDGIATFQRSACASS